MKHEELNELWRKYAAEKRLRKNICFDYIDRTLPKLGIEVRPTIMWPYTVHFATSALVFGSMFAALYYIATPDLHVSLEQYLRMSLSCAGVIGAVAVAIVFVTRTKYRLGSWEHFKESTEETVKHNDKGTS